jgi:hypothetical protein
MKLTLPQVLEWVIYRDRNLIDAQATIFDVLDQAIRNAGDDEEKAQHPLRARDSLLAELRSGNLTAYGIQSNGALHEKIPPIHWEVIDSLTVLPSRIGVRDVGRGDNTIYRDVLIDREVVVALWPDSGPTTNYRTGAPGRPSAIHFVEVEWRKRRDAGEALKTLSDEAKALHRWCAENHPAIVAPKPKSIENKIRSEFQAFKKSPHN